MRVALVNQLFMFRYLDGDNDFDGLITNVGCTNDPGNICTPHAVVVEYGLDGTPSGCHLFTLSDQNICTTCQLCEGGGVQYDCFFGQAVSDGCRDGFEINPYPFQEFIPSDVDVPPPALPAENSSFDDTGADIDSSAESSFSLYGTFPVLATLPFVFWLCL